VLTPPSIAYIDNLPAQRCRDLRRDGQHDCRATGIGVRFASLFEFCDAKKGYAGGLASSQRRTDLSDIGDLGLRDGPSGQVAHVR